MKSLSRRIFKVFFMPALALVLIVTIAVVFLWLWVVFGVQWIKRLTCPSDDACAVLGQVGDIFGGVNALFAGLAFGGVLISIHLARKAQLQQNERDRDEKLVEQICLSYQWAYEALVSEMQGEVPAPVRLNWLTCARHLLRAKRLTDSLQTELYRTVHAEHEEYWRSRFYELLNKPGLRQTDYYRKREAIDLDYRSVAVVADFLTWKEDEVDPLQTISVASFKWPKIGTPLWFGLRAYLQAYHVGIYRHIEEMDEEANRTRKAGDSA